MTTPKSFVSQDSQDAMRDVQVQTYLLTDDGQFPNNARLPLLIYPNALNAVQINITTAFEALFSAHHWPPAWRNGIFSVHHYHSTAHEVLGIYSGHADIQFGGPHGPVLTAHASDVIVIPAGVAHKNQGHSADFAVVGAYPQGQSWDTCYGSADERPHTDKAIAQVAMPVADPIYGISGPLLSLWSS